MAATKTLGLVVMEIKLNAFFNGTQFPHSNGPISPLTVETGFMRFCER